MRCIIPLSFLNMLMATNNALWDLGNPSKLSHGGISYILIVPLPFKLKMCSVSTNGEQDSSAQQGSQLIGCNYSYILQLISMLIY